MKKFGSGISLIAVNFSQLQRWCEAPGWVSYAQNPPEVPPCPRGTLFSSNVAVWIQEGRMSPDLRSAFSRDRKWKNVMAQPCFSASLRLSELLAAMRPDYSMAISPLKVFDTYSKIERIS